MEFPSRVYLISATSVKSFERRLDKHGKNLPSKYDINEELPTARYLDFHLCMQNQELETDAE